MFKFTSLLKLILFAATASAWLLAPTIHALSSGTAPQENTSPKQKPGNEKVQQKKILILNSYHRGYKGSDNIVEGFQEHFATAFPDADIKIEYLDSNQYHGAEFDQKVLDLLRFKYRQRHFDLVFSTDDYAFNVLEKNRDDIFPGTPVVFCGTNSFDSSRLIGKQGFYGIDERPSFGETLDLIFRLHPETRDVVVVHDTGVTGQRNSSEFRAHASSFDKRARFSYWAGLGMEELTSRVKALREGTVLVYFANFVEDANGARVPTAKAQELLAEISPVPIYGGWAFMLGKGIVGGKLINLREHGSLAARLAVKVLVSGSPGSLARFSPSPNQYMFDYQQMARFDIAESQLPEGSIVVNMPPGFLQSYKVPLLTGISGMLLLALIGSFMKLLKSRKQLAESLAELQEAQSKLMLTARKAGMAEIATNVLHNVGNVLNSVNISAGVVAGIVHDSRVGGLSRTVKLLNQHSGDLGEYMTRDEKGKLLPKYLEKLSEALAEEQREVLKELSQMTKSVDHIKEIVATQQSFAGAASIIEPVLITDLLEDALRINAEALDRHHVVVVKEYAELPLLQLDKARLLQILVNLISNAKNAMDSKGGEGNTLTLRSELTDDNRLRISVSDQGRGIAPENLSRIFNHGFTTRAKGHGFGLHSCALAANEMGGTLTAASPGIGKGSTFTLEFPCGPAARSSRDNVVPGTDEKEESSKALQQLPASV